MGSQGHWWGLGLTSRFPGPLMGSRAHRWCPGLINGVPGSPTGSWAQPMGSQGHPWGPGLSDGCSPPPPAALSLRCAPCAPSVHPLLAPPSAVGSVLCSPLSWWGGLGSALGTAGSAQQRWCCVCWFGDGLVLRDGTEGFVWLFVTGRKGRWCAGDGSCVGDGELWARGGHGERISAPR